MNDHITLVKLETVHLYLDLKQNTIFILIILINVIYDTHHIIVYYYILYLVRLLSGL